jgi:CheY-like chemotaxis protein
MGQPVILWLQMDFTKQYTWKPVEIKKTEVQKIEHDSSQLDASDMPRAGSVLIADDDDLSLLLLRSVLTRYGIRADHVKGGMSALEKYREKKYDLLILDYEMPDKNGLEVTETIRKTDVDTPIVLLTGVDMSENELHGVNSYLSKPIQKEALRSILVQTLGKK